MRAAKKRGEKPVCGRRAQVRWYALAGGACALFLSACAALVFAYYRRAITEEFTAMAVENLDAYTAAQRDETLSGLHDIMNTLQALAVLVAENNTPEFVEVSLRAMNEENPDARILYNTSEELNERLGDEDIRPEDVEIIRLLQRGQTTVTPIIYSRRLGDLYCVAVAVPVFRGGECLGALRCVANAEMLVRTSVYPPSQGKVLYSFLVDATGGTIPVRGDGSDPQENLLEEMESRSAPPEAVEGLKKVLAAEGSELGSFLLGTYHGSPCYLSVADLGYNDWHLALVVQADRAAVHSRAIVLRTTYGAAALLVCGVLFCLVIFLLLARLLRRLNREQQRYLLLEQFSDTVLFDYERKSDTIRFTPNAQTLFRVHELTQQNFVRDMGAMYIHEADRGAIRELLQGAGGEAEAQARVRLLQPEEERYFWCLVQVRYAYERGELAAVFGKVTDIDQQKRREERLLHISETDGLTGLRNRRAAQEAITGRLRADPAGILFMLDVDDFKKINDTCGHESGDHALQYAAQCMKSVFRAGDVLGRLGGDELVAYAGGTGSVRLARQKMEQLLELLQRGEKDVPPMSVSVGIACFPADGADYDSLYRAADQAMYRAKGQGKNGYSFAGGV
ncbi:GGDEF domain-containing protein [Allofournierella sp.]|uniref:GGDEF domain-containing protein n=1 Tax=Allofournierella sp. TaxID=1940256 RepID=UPI003AB5A59B